MIAWALIFSPATFALVFREYQVRCLSMMRESIQDNPSNGKAMNDGDTHHLIATKSLVAVGISRLCSRYFDM